jgi:hypothetical protein
MTCVALRDAADDLVCGALREADVDPLFGQ